MQAHARKIVIVLVFATLAIRQIKKGLTVGGDFDLPTEVEKVGTKWNGKNNAATFLGMELAFLRDAKPSVVHCVGDNFLPKTSAGYRSCQFRQLCFSLSKKEFVIFPSEQDQFTLSLLKSMDSRYVRASFEVNNISVATSATSENRLRQGIDGDWFPSPLVAKHLHNNSGLYQLPDDVVLVPVYFPEDGSMPLKDVLFDFFLPIFNLLSMFELQDKKILLANLRSSSCTHANATLCYKNVMAFLPLMNKDFNRNNAFLDVAIHNINDLEGGHLGNRKHRPNHICARFGAAGIGALTEHGIHKKSHGERIKDYTFVHNSGRGKLFFDFRNHLLGNMGMKRAEDKAKNDIPAKITISMSQSKRSGVHDFREQLRAIQSHFPKDKVHVQEYNMLELPLTTQLEIASETSIFISVMGDGALPAFFLPWGATLILFYNDESEFVSVTKSEKTFPVKLDWDLWNNLSYIRVHWLPLGGKNGAEDLDMLLKLISTTLDLKMHTPDRNTGDKRSGTPDGTFNGVDVHFVDGRNQASTCHCVGENFQDEAQTFRSCQFQYMCLDLNSEHRNFSLAVSRQQSELMHSIEKRDTSPAFVSTSATGRSSMMIGQTIRFHQGSGWFPVSSDVPLESFYEISGDVVWVPFYAEQPNINNPGHLIWDYFMPFFNLLAMFGLEDHQLLLSNIDDSCSPDADNPCWGLMTKFLPLLGVDPSTFQSTRTSVLNINGESRRSSIVCARNAVAGIGFLTGKSSNKNRDNSLLNHNFDLIGWESY